MAVWIRQQKAGMRHRSFFYVAGSLTMAACWMLLPLGHAQTPAAKPVAPAQTTPPADIDRGPAYYHYGLAKLYESLAAQGRQDYATQAIEEYKLAMGLDPSSETLNGGLADLYFHLGRVREAVTAAQDQVAKHPNDAAAHELLGRVYLSTLGDGQSQESSQMLQLAIKEYETLVRLKPDDLESHLLLGQLYGLDHNSAKAEAQFREAQRLDSGSEEVALSMARLYVEQGDLQKAAKSLEQIPAGDRSARMEFALAGIYDQMHKPKDAATAYQRSLDLNPDNADARRGLAAAQLADGQLSAADKTYSDLSASDPQDAQSLVQLAKIQRQQGHYDQALATLKKAKERVNGDAELDYNLGLTYDALGQYDEAIAAMKQAGADLNATDSSNGGPADNSNRALFLDRIAIIDREAGHTDEAVAAYEAMRALGSDYEARAAAGLIDTYRDGHEWDKATAAAAEAAKSMPKNKDIQLAYARQLADGGKLDAALKLADSQLSGTPDDREVYYTVADMDVRAKRYKEAYAALDKITPLATQPDDRAFLAYYRGTIADREKVYDQAEIEFRKGLAIDPNDASIENDLGYMLADRDVKLPEALALIQKAVTFDPQNGAYLDSLGWVYYREGQYTLAEDYLVKAIARSGNDPSVLDHLGEVYEKNGKLQLAVQMWQRSLEAYHTSLTADADPADVIKVEHKLDAARVKLAHASAPAR